MWLGKRTVYGTTALLYGTGMRLMEGLRLRVRDVDFDRNAIVVREAIRDSGTGLRSAVPRFR